MPSKIDWCDETINPLGWGCYGPGGTAEHPKVCSYCYADRFARRQMRECPDCRAFVPHWHPEQLEQMDRWRKPRRIFVQSMGDLFGDWVPEQRIRAVIRWAEVLERHTFLFLTKNPARMARFSFPPNAWVGVSVTNQPDFDTRGDKLGGVNAARRFISFEPLLGPVEFLPVEVPWLEWAIIGAQTGPGARPVDPTWVSDLTRRCDDDGVPVFMKRSLAGLGFTRRDMP